MDYLRVIAILAVLLSHGYGIFGLQSIYPSISPYVGFLGSVGVILFFFISGFLISRITPESPKSLLHSFKDRIKRIGPLFWTALLLTALLFSFHIYQGYWIKNFDLFNVVMNGLFLVNFTPRYDIPPFWFISSLVLFTGIYLLLRYLNKNIFYYAISSMAVYFLFILLEMGGLMWALNGFIYYILGTLVGNLYYAGILSFDRIHTVHPVISMVSAASYATYLFHLVIFGGLVQFFAILSLSNSYLEIGLALVFTLFICILIQKGYEMIQSQAGRMFMKGMGR